MRSYLTSISGWLPNSPVRGQSRETLPIRMTDVGSSNSPTDTRRKALAEQVCEHLDPTHSTTCSLLKLA
jgi:hypothetical protein